MVQFTNRVCLVTGALSHHLSVLQPTGLTACFGLMEIGRPRAGETVLVSSAAGAVGSIPAQIARIHGCRVVGIAGGVQLDAALDCLNPRGSRALWCSLMPRGFPMPWPNSPAYLPRADRGRAGGRHPRLPPPLRRHP